MQIVISPAKSLNFDIDTKTIKTSENLFLEKAEELILELRKYSPQALQKLLSINEKLALLNHERYKHWKLPFSNSSAKPALFAFTGHVYKGIEVESMSKESLSFAQKHLNILSGLYGVLKPLDNIMPYRLEMGTKLPNKKGDNLYRFWENELTNYINKRLSHDDDILINLASSEYFKSLNTKILKANRIITPTFKEYKNGKPKQISVFAKRARGLMTRFIIDNKITDHEEIKLFDKENYFYEDRLSDKNTWVFTR